MNRALLLALALGIAAPSSAQLIQRNPGGRPVFESQDSPWTTNDLVCVTAPNEISVGGTCNSLGGGGGGTLTSSGATSARAVCLDEELATVASQASVTTAATLDAGSIVHRCVTRTNVAVSGGYWLGLAGAEDIWGATAGTLGATNALDVTMPAPAPIVSTQGVVATSTHSSGQYQDNTGRIRVVCFCDEIGAPTE